MQQQSLFENPFPPGLRYKPEFLDREQEAKLIEQILTLPLQHSKYKEYTARRRTVSFGYSYDFSENMAQPAPPPPGFLLELQNRIAAWARLRSSEFVQVLVSEYQPGVPLGWHRDVPDFDAIVGLSLASAARLRFRPYPWRPELRKRVFALEVEPRSIYLLRDEARWGWQHSVPPVPHLRYSITFRTGRARVQKEPRG
ncbi:MAG TPA: alpha-ketoglutarate-dependent dioxygenase AlkB [Steroidobacteraceae bacterium]|nr:alpha-ketoglutarate-dependent dioxygenase AlkB [Steroidobacteraceae bacterium]